MVPCRNEADRRPVPGFGPCVRLSARPAGGDCRRRHEPGRHARADRRSMPRATPESGGSTIPTGTTPPALNRAIRAAQGDLILRLDAHAGIAPAIFRARSEPRVVGSRLRGRRDADAGAGPGLFAEPIRSRCRIPLAWELALSTGGETPRWVDTVFGACWKREVFARIGGFDERLERSQDIEFSSRLRRAGGKILMAPEMKIDYCARTTWAASGSRTGPTVCGPFFRLRMYPGSRCAGGTWRLWPWSRVWRDRLRQGPGLESGGWDGVWRLFMRRRTWRHRSARPGRSAGSRWHS